jgi:hypothetical protein
MSHITSEVTPEILRVVRSSLARERESRTVEEVWCDSDRKERFG